MTPSPTSHSVALRRTFDAPPQRVFRAWLEPEVLARWFAPSDDFTVLVHAVDARVGGDFRIEMRHVSGKSHIAFGTYREIEPPRRLVFTWHWEDEPDLETLVSLEIEAHGQGSELSFLHELFTTEAAARDHNQGWIGCLNRLAATL